MVSSFPLDYMHACCLGIVKRIIKFWLGKDKVKNRLECKLTSANVEEINKRIEHINLQTKGVFVRKLRDIDKVGLWKATECRQFLLYLFPPMMKDILNEKFYTHFKLLYVACRILADVSNSKDPDCLIFARTSLLQFVQQAHELYEGYMSTYNTHILIHLTDDVERFGCLDSFSSFPFENEQRYIGELLTSKINLNAQISNRIRDETYNPFVPFPTPRRTAVNNVYWEYKHQWLVRERPNKVSKDARKLTVKMYKKLVDDPTLGLDLEKYGIQRIFKLPGVKSVLRKNLKNKHFVIYTNRIKVAYKLLHCEKLM
jgi:hypothetical protein